ncbi:MAG TPA: M20/M25/M40 family metallo-hydrolase [Phycisphaerales bacterium]|nr:M20/M25/M40 family metallo-hydrolase [Phycisphaerales bacterium]
MNLDAVMGSLDGREKAGLSRLFDWLRMPSISTDPKYTADVRRAAEWCAAQLRECGLTAELRETGTKENPGHPVVWATHGGPAGYSGPHVLFYGHYDVQPPDPLELWESPPFEPVIKPADAGPAADVPGERIVARGAVDDKGQVACFLEALRAWKESGGGVPIKLSVLIEGEEESGSKNLEDYCKRHEKEIRACDVCVISDTGMLQRGHPAITTGVRGLTYTEVVLHGPNQDLHSGLWGGRMPNPANELVKVLSQLWDSKRRVTLPGFYDSVREPTPGEREAWKKLPFDPIAALNKIGLGADANVGEEGWTATEREWARPTAEINGIFGGYMSKGAKTVIPSFAGAKVSFRLVADQDPAKVFESFKAWLNARTPPGCKWDVHHHSGGFPGNVSIDNPYLTAAVHAIESASGKKPHLIKSGGSIPVVGMLKGQFGLDTLLVGFGLDDDRVHSPNEKFELSCYRLGVRTHARLLGEFAAMKK